MKRLLDTHNFRIVMVKSGKFLEKAQRLRYKVFFKQDGRDQDRFDRFCRHLVAIEKETRKVVGTYRLLLRSTAEKNIGFYSETEFDLKNIKRHCKGELLELGRACVDLPYRRYPILYLMWKAVVSFVEDNNVSYIFGCSSVDTPSSEKVNRIYTFLKHRFFSSSRFRVYPLKGKRYPHIKSLKDIDEMETVKLVPALIKNYLKLGAVVCGDPVWDKTFDTVDFFMMLDMKKSRILNRIRLL